ncbi:stalk domain-containing protein [Aminipila terrae]|uniref:Copper amine oxidase-like N-terminal domain-containing protein n=1 Tax=Aminipila terrae TaxID=2697030 RepID=A0A6P1MHQ9_9FIRM|nr:stalk domain-containing protein [Aminipila terrae]QHI72713.1 hypothetical protein Ami3637_10160 [Aminipila terrae]
MRKQFKGFIAGFIFACMLVIPGSVFADNIQALFNTANIAVDGKTAVKQGENYQLSDGSTVPFSINYKGTTYIPIRKVSELLGIGINYDNATKTVQITSNSNSTVVTPQKPTETTTTSSAVTSSTSYCVFNECNKDANSSGDKVAHVIGFKDGVKMDTYLDYSYYTAISSKMSSAQLWETTMKKGNVTKLKAVGASKSGEVLDSDGRNSVSLSSGQYELSKKVVVYQWTDDNEYRTFTGDLKKNDYANLYDTDGDKKYDVVIFNRNGKTLPEGDSSTVKEAKDSTANTNNSGTTSGTTTKTDTSSKTYKIASTGYAVINECMKDANSDGDKVQHVVGFLEGRKLDAATSERNTVNGWKEPVLSGNGFNNAALYKMSVNSIDVIATAEKVSPNVDQAAVEKADKRNSVTIAGKTYNLSSSVIVYQVTKDDEYRIYTGDIKDNDIVQLYETDSSKDGYDIVICSRP